MCRFFLQDLHGIQSDGHGSFLFAKLFLFAKKKREGFRNERTQRI